MTAPALSPQFVSAAKLADRLIGRHSKEAFLELRAANPDVMVADLALATITAHLRASALLCLGTGVPPEAFAGKLEQLTTDLTRRYAARKHQ